MCRNGGDEFAIVLPDTGALGAGTVALRILEPSHDLTLKGGDRPPIAATVSIEAAAFETWAGHPPGENRSHRYFGRIAAHLVRAADEQL